MRKILGLALFISSNLIAQTKGVVKDSLSGNPIPYVSIWVENENIGTTSEENGEFSINVNDKNKNLIFSALGFKKKIVKVGEANLVSLAPMALDLPEVMISNRKDKKQIEIGRRRGVAEAFDNGPRMDAKFFPFLTDYKKTRWIKSVAIFTDSRIDQATIKVHLYEVDENGFPGEEMLTKDLIVPIKRGISKTEVDLTDFNLEMPKNGIFVVVERLLIEKNKLKKIIKDQNTNTTKIQVTYSPLVLYNSVEKEFLFSFSGGRWHKLTPKELNPISGTNNIYEPSVTLTLSN